jgi:hypothetical protein
MQSRIHCCDKALVSEALNEPVIITEDGGRRKISKGRAIIT